MNLTLWIATVLLALVILATTRRLTQPKAKLAASGQGWTEDLSNSAVKSIGTLEILDARGLILPTPVHPVRHGHRMERRAPSLRDPHATTANSPCSARSHYHRRRVAEHP
jgi:hypothetical protein